MESDLCGVRAQWCSVFTLRNLEITVTGHPASHDVVPAQHSAEKARGVPQVIARGRKDDKQNGFGARHL